MTQENASYRLSPPVQLWLAALCLLLAAMTVIGGYVRLTHSGLSITDWKPVMGALPPMSEAQWQTLFERYKTVPHYESTHLGITLDEFKPLYWREWSHRILGRLIGVVFLIPFCFFWLTGRIPKERVGGLAGIFLLGALQGLLGWHMVRSGLADNPDVSAYRLAAHLGLAFIIYALLFRLLLASLRPPSMVLAPWARDVAARAKILIALIFLQIMLGAFVAGLDAGLIHNSWPLMDGGFFPENLFAYEPLWRNFFENPSAVQFSHRVTGYILAGYLVFHIWRGSGLRPARAFMPSAYLLGGLMAAQILLGIGLLWFVSPMALALAHQLGGLIVWSAAWFHWHDCLSRGAART